MRIRDSAVSRPSVKSLTSNPTGGLRLLVLDSVGACSVDSLCSDLRVDSLGGERAVKMNKTCKMGKESEQ